MSSLLQKDRFLTDGRYWISGHILNGAYEAVAYLTGQGFSMDDACDYLKVLIDELQREIEIIESAKAPIL